MWRIVIFIAVIILLYFFTSDLNIAVRESRDKATETYETLKQKTDELVSEVKGEITLLKDKEEHDTGSKASGDGEGDSESDDDSDGDGERDSDSQGDSDSNNMSDDDTDSEASSFWDRLWNRKDRAVEKFEETKDKYLQMKRDLEEKYEQLQKAIREVEEAKIAIDELISKEEQQ